MTTWAPDKNSVCPCPMSISCHSFTVALESRCFWYFCQMIIFLCSWICQTMPNVWLPNKANKWVIAVLFNSKWYWQKMTKSAIQLFRAKTHHWKGSALLVGFHATGPKTVLRRSQSRICLVFDVFRHSQGTTSDSCAGHSIFWTWNGRDVSVAKQY